MSENEYGSIARIEVAVGRVDGKLDWLISELFGREGDPGRIPKMEQKLADCEIFRERVRGISIAIGCLLTLAGFLHKMGWL